MLLQVLAHFSRDLSRCAPIFSSIRCIHAKAGQTPSAERRRKLQRPTLPGLKDHGTFPLLPARFGVDTDGRTNRTSKQRRQIQLSKSPAKLLWQVQEAIKTQGVDASVFGAAMQKCGQCRWWDALQKVRDLQRSARIKLYPIQRNICITALTRCIRGEHGFGVVKARRQQLLSLGMEVWNETESACDAVTFNSGLGAALRLCAAANEKPGLCWAEELWAWAHVQDFKLNPLSFQAFILVLAVYQLTDRVDRMLSEFSTTFGKPSTACLGELVNTSAEHRDWRRSGELWARFVNDFEVEPSAIAYGSRAKAHMLCGRPHAAASAATEMLGKDMPLNPELAESHVQALLLVYHSSSALADYEDLKMALQRGSPIISEASKWQRTTWQQMKDMTTDLHRNPSSVRLCDVLIEWKAKQSVMASWGNYAAGSNYLKQVEQE